MCVRIGCDGPEIIEIGLPRRRIALLEHALVGDRLRLHVLDRGEAALTIVTVEKRVGIGAVPDLGELLGDVEAVLEAAVHAHPTDRIVDMGGIAGEDDTALPEASRDALVHIVHVAVYDLVRTSRRQAFGKPGLNPRITHDFLVGFLGLCREHAAPKSLVVLTGHLHERNPTLRMCALIAQTESELSEVVGGRHDVETLGPGEALERHTGGLANDAAPAVATEQIP